MLEILRVCTLTASEKNKVRVPKSLLRSKLSNLGRIISAANSRTISAWVSETSTTRLSFISLIVETVCEIKQFEGAVQSESRSLISFKSTSSRDISIFVSSTVEGAKLVSRV